MERIFDGKVYDILPTSNGVIFSYFNGENDDGTVDVSYKMISFENRRMTDIAKNVYMITKFGNGYKAVEKLCENYHKQFPDEELPEIWPLAAYPALVARDGGNLDYNGKTEHSEAERQFYLQKSQMEAFETRLKAEGYNFKERVQIGATIGTHIGPGVFGMIFVQK